MRGHRKVEGHIWSFYLQVSREKGFIIIVHDFKKIQAQLQSRLDNEGKVGRNDGGGQ